MTVDVIKKTPPVTYIKCIACIGVTLDMVTTDTYFWLVYCIYIIVGLFTYILLQSVQKYNITVGVATTVIIIAIIIIIIIVKMVMVMHLYIYMRYSAVSHRLV